MAAILRFLTLSPLLLLVSEVRWDNRACTGSLGPLLMQCPPPTVSLGSTACSRSPAPRPQLASPPQPCPLMAAALPGMLVGRVPLFMNSGAAGPRRGRLTSPPLGGPPFHFILGPTNFIGSPVCYVSLR